MFGLLNYTARGNNVWRVRTYNGRMQRTESYEAINDDSNQFLFISCPDWGVNANWGIYDMCPHSSTTTDNGTVQDYKEFQGGTGYPQFVEFTQTFTYDGLNRLTSASDSGGWSRTFNYDQWGNSW